jgi:two-component system, probable response regulator PhcQ
MPGMRGADFLAKVRQEFPDTVRFMLTGKATLEVALQAINEGAISRFFTKPCNPSELALTIKQALQQRDLMLEAKRLLRVTRKQAATIENLERHHPGITQVRRDQYGTIIAEPEEMSIEALLQELRCEVTRSEARFNTP